MSGSNRWWVALLLSAALGAGCQGVSPGSLAYFFLPEDKEPPELRRLAAQDKKKEVKVVLLTHAALDPRPETIQADRQLAEALAKELNQLFQEDQEKVTVVPPRRVEEYKNNHPSRHGYDPVEVGEHFKVDYVIYIEINKLSLYERGAYDTLLRGRADLLVSVVDLKHPDENPDSKEFTCVYPSESKGALAADPETPVTMFRQAFLQDVARRVSYFFAPHPKRDRMMSTD
jgi:hypothetical protein